MGSTKIKKIASGIFGGNIICRIIAGWLFVAALNICLYPGFDDISWQSNIKPARDVAVFFAVYIALSVLFALCKRLDTDAAALFVCGMFCSVSAACRKGDFLFLLAVIIGMFFVALYFVNKNEKMLESIVISRKTVNIAALLLSVLCFAVISAIGILRYKAFDSPNYDFGIFVNMFYNMRKCGLPLSTCERDGLISHFAVHFSPMWYAFLPFYFVFPHPETLQICQGAAVAVGAIPALLLARENKLSEKLQLLSVGLYCLMPVLTTGTTFDVHENCLLAPLILWTIYFYEKKKYLPFALFALSVMLVKEDAAVYIIIFALYIIFCDKNYLVGIITSSAAILYFIVVTTLMKKYGLGIMSGRYGNLILDSADGLFGVFKTAIKSPAYVLTQVFKMNDGSFVKVQYLLQLLLPLGFIPLASKKPSGLILALPICMNLITTYPYQCLIKYQYHFGIATLLVYAFIKNVGDCPKNIRRSLCTLAFVSCVILYSANAFSPLADYVKYYSDNHGDYEKIEAVLAEIPDDASVCASCFFVPHLAGRDVIYETEYHNGVLDTDYIVIDARYGGYENNLWHYRNMGYETEAEAPGLVIVMRRGFTFGE